MGVLIGRNGWRQYLGLAAALVAALVTFLAAGRTVKPREEEPRVRLVDSDAGGGAAQARVRSLWSEGRGFECLVPAFYGIDKSARFASVLLWRSATAPPTSAAHSPVGALWARLASVYDHGDMTGPVSIEAAEPAVVSIQRSASFARTAEAA